MEHSSVVGGSTAKRVMMCPGSVALVAQAPVMPSNAYADKGTLLHTAISEVFLDDKRPEELIGMEYEGHVLDQDMCDEKLWPAIKLMDEIDPDQEMEIAVETRVAFGSYLPGAFGSTDLLGRIGNTAFVIDWKFGDGVIVDAEENHQLMYYAAAAMRTPAVAHIFKGVDVIECVIIQPPAIRRWTTTPARIKKFERDLKGVIKIAKEPDAPLAAGAHCRFCPAKPTCPKMTGAVDRALKVKLDAIDNDMLCGYAANAVLLQGWIDDLNKLVELKLSKGAKIPGWKLVAKRGTRKWVDEAKAAAALTELGVEPYKKELLSPAQAEKKTKNLPEGLTVSVSSGDTVAPESDPRPAVLQIGQHLAALSKIL
jgi:hypothetical protein